MNAFGKHAQFFFFFLFNFGKIGVVFCCDSRVCDFAVKASDGAAKIIWMERTIKGNASSSCLRSLLLCVYRERRIAAGCGDLVTPTRTFLSEGVIGVRAITQVFCAAFCRAPFRRSFCRRCSLCAHTESIDAETAIVSVQRSRCHNNDRKATGFKGTTTKRHACVAHSLELTSSIAENYSTN